MFEQELDNLQQSFKQNTNPSYNCRISLLNQLELILIENKHELINVVNNDFQGRAAKETSLYEIIPAIEEIRHTKYHLRSWSKKQKRGPSILLQGAKSYLCLQPKGVVGIMVPWNYPIFLSIGPLVPAIAAGNKVMLKLSEDTPQTSELLKVLLHKYLGLDNIQVITGDVSVAQEFSKLPLDHLLFTGSTSIGYHILSDAAKIMKPVTLELGGKSPCLISHSANIKLSTKRIINGKLINAGQTCVAPDYVLLHKNQQPEFIKYAKEHVKCSYPDILNNNNYTSIINKKQFTRLQNLLTDAKEKGATLIPLAESAEHQQNGARCMPYIILNATRDMLVMQQEIFGPLLPVIIQDSISNMISYINDDDEPLALYYFGSNKGEQQIVLDSIQAGGVTINGVIAHVAEPSLPFGGVGKSGMGQYHGQEGFNTFSNKKPVFEQKNISALDHIQAPYGYIANLAEKTIPRINLKYLIAISRNASLVTLGVAIVYGLSYLFKN